MGWLLLGMFSISAAVMGGIGEHPRLFQLAYLVGFVGFFILLRVVTKHGASHRLGHWPLWLAGCVLIRIPLLWAQPSDDLYRYVWEGRVQSAGQSPYLMAPDDPGLILLRDQNWQHINHPDHPGIYPPLAQLEFRLAAAIHPSVTFFKCLHTLWDLIALAALASCLVAVGLPPHFAIVYGACPLVLSAFALEGHIDSLMLMWLAVMLALCARKKWILGGAMLGLAISSKIVAIVFLPWFLWRQGRAAAAACLIVGVSCLPFLDSGLQGLRNLAHFARMSEFFSFLGGIGITEFETETARRIGVGALLVLLAYEVFRCRDVFTYVRRATMWLLLALPVVHYWYVSWALLASTMGRHARWLVLSLAMVLYFEAEVQRSDTGQWAMPEWIPTAVWRVFLLVLIIEVVVRRVRGKRLTASD